MTSSSSDRRHISGTPATAPLGHAQLSIVEHALCPLDTAAGLDGPFIHETGYCYTDANRHRRRATVRVACPEGLSPTDEYYLWGLLSLTFAQDQPALDFYATPYFCMRRLLCIDSASRGGKNFQLFRDAITRLAAVSYRNDRFYDPVRAEHRQVSFGLFSYSLPLDLESSRAWRFAWDPVFFEFCSAASGALRFEFRTFRQLDPATRRLYLLLKKIFWRSPTSPAFDLRELAVDVLGFSAGHDTYELKRKVARCLTTLADRQFIVLPDDAASPMDLFTKQGKGRYALTLYRGPAFLRPEGAPQTPALTDSPHYEPLSQIGLDDKAIAYVLRSFQPRVIAECADITLAAGERFGETFFKTSRPAYFMDNLKHFAAGKRTPPDWWRELRKQEELRRRSADKPSEKDDAFERDFDAYLAGEAKDAFENVMQRMFRDFRNAGQPEPDARDRAERIARTHFLHRFRSEHRPARSDGPQRLSDFLS